MIDLPRSEARGLARRALGVVVTGALLLVAVAALVALLAMVTGHDPSRALGALWNGSLGSRYAVFSATLVRATPLILTGLAVTLAFTAGVMNIGAEGQLLSGATASVIVSLAADRLGWLTIPFSLLAGGVAGAAWAYVPAILRRRFGVLEVISTIMMNFVALYLVGYLVRGPLQEPLHIYPQTAEIVKSAQLPIVIPGTRLHLGFLVALACAAALWWFLRWTAAAFAACFTAPTCRTFCYLVAGWLQCPGRHTVTGVALAAGAGVVGWRHISAFHRLSGLDPDS